MISNPMTHLAEQDHLHLRSLPATAEGNKLYDCVVSAFTEDRLSCLMC